MWLQGAYFYEALSRVSPLLHAFAKRVQTCSVRGRTVCYYGKQAEYQQEEKDKKTYDKGKALIEGFMAKHNKKFEGK